MFKAVYAYPTAFTSDSQVPVPYSGRLSYAVLTAVERKRDIIFNFLLFTGTFNMDELNLEVLARPNLEISETMKSWYNSICSQAQVRLLWRRGGLST